MVIQCVSAVLREDTPISQDSSTISHYSALLAVVEAEVVPWVLAPSAAANSVIVAAYFFVLERLMLSDHTQISVDIAIKNMLYNLVYSANTKHYANQVAILMPRGRENKSCYDQ